MIGFVQKCRRYSLQDMTILMFLKYCYYRPHSAIQLTHAHAYANRFHHLQTFYILLASILSCYLYNIDNVFDC